MRKRSGHTHTYTTHRAPHTPHTHTHTTEGLFGDVKAGFFSLWNAIPESITTKVSSVVQDTTVLLKSGISHVQEVGIIQGAKDGVSATVELAEHSAKATISMTKKVGWH